MELSGEKDMSGTTGSTDSSEPHLTQAQWSALCSSQSGSLNPVTGGSCTANPHGSAWDVINSKLAFADNTNMDFSDAPADSIWLTELVALKGSALRITGVSGINAKCMVLHINGKPFDPNESIINNAMAYVKSYSTIMFQIAPVTNIPKATNPLSGSSGNLGLVSPLIVMCAGQEGSITGDNSTKPASFTLGAESIKVTEVDDTV
jgi:hypothetical protein